MRADKFLGVVSSCLLVGCFIGYVAALDSPPPGEQRGTEWETLVAGAAAILGGWLAYQGALIPFKERRKALHIQFQYDVKYAGQDVWGFLGRANHSLDGGQGIFTFNRKDGSSFGPTKVDQFREMALAHLNNMPPIPSEIISSELIRIYKDLEQALYIANLNPNWELDDVLNYVDEHMQRFENYIAMNS